MNGRIWVRDSLENKLRFRLLVFQKEKSEYEKKRLNNVETR